MGKCLNKGKVYRDQVKPLLVSPKSALMLLKRIPIEAMPPQTYDLGGFGAVSAGEEAEVKDTMREHGHFGKENLSIGLGGRVCMRRQQHRMGIEF